jgi:hypothetical protein
MKNAFKNWIKKQRICISHDVSILKDWDNYFCAVWWSLLKIDLVAFIFEHPSYASHFTYIHIWLVTVIFVHYGTSCIGHVWFKYKVWEFSLLSNHLFMIYNLRLTKLTEYCV